jgi:HD-GYP domain-containing protein (c-di-GMP phosphodiesterase class II)
VADAYDAIASARPYRPATAPEAVLERIVVDSGIHFDPQVIDALVRHFATDDQAEEEVSRVGV